MCDVYDVCMMSVSACVIDCRFSGCALPQCGDVQFRFCKLNARVFKSHERPGDIAQGGRYIHVCRDPTDAFVSFHRFLPAWTGIHPGAITAEEFAQAEKHVFGDVVKLCLV